VAVLCFAGRRVTPAVVARGLRRFPEANVLELRFSAARGFGFEEALAGGVGAGRFAEVRLERVWVRDAGLEFLARVCTGLRELQIRTCHGWGDAGLVAAVPYLAGRLRALELVADGQVSDAAGVLVAKLVNLERLSIAGAPRLTDVTFRALAGLRRLRRLRLAKTGVSDAGLAAVLGGVPGLISLDVSECAALTPAVLGVLPTGLRSLRANCTAVLATVAVPAAALVELHAREAQALSMWWPLSGGVAARLRVLDLWRSGVTGVGVVEVLPRMRGLEVLTLGECRGVDDVVAFAVSSLPRLVRVDLSGTVVTAHGARGLGACCATLRVVDLCNCPRIRQKENVRAHLLRALQPGASIILG
jgi:hypothetical protein